VAQKFTVPITVKQLASAGSDAVTVYVDQDTFSRLKVEAGGRLTWGSGASAGDVNLYRASADVLQTDDTFKTPVLFVDNIEIDPTGATTDQVLKFNGTKFIASTVSSGALNLDGLSDVTAPTPANGEVLQWNGTAWVPSLVVGPAGPAGENGMAGAAGESGAPGADGMDGMDGADGMNGADGADGAPGEPGPPGETGATGPAGADGAGSVKYVFATNASPVASGQITFGSQVYFPFVSEIKIHVYSKNGTQNNGWIALWESGGNLLISNSAGDVAMFTLNSAPTLSSSVYTIDVTSFNTWDAARYLELSFGFDGTNNFNEDVSIIYIPGVPAAVSGAVNTSDVGTVTSTMILDGTIVNADISTSAGIELSKLSTTGASSGNVITYNGSAWTAASAGGGGASLEVSTTAPASPTEGALWFNSATLETYIYYDNHWLQVTGEPDLVEDLTDLSDVTLTTPVNGQFLKYDGTRWVNGTIPTINTLDDIGDVSVSSPSSGQFLKWNGSAWVPDTIIGGATISDTAPASPSAGQIWFQSTNGKTFVYYDSSWIEVGGVGSGARMVSSSSAPASPLEGSMWFNSLTGGTFVYYGTNWIEVGASPFSALVNTINAKGDLLVGTADNTIGGLTTGSDDQVLTVDSSTATGLKWATPTTYATTGKAIAMAIVFGG
jgi:hypothetical protein